MLPKLNIGVITTYVESDPAQTASAKSVFVAFSCNI